ncbi:MAG: YicC/YloC family endoribonuclease [Hyphomicrobiaceae bacterium]
MSETEHSCIIPPRQSGVRVPVISMTGFGSASGQSAGAQWAWELRSVNGRGADVRVRLPPGFERLEARSKERILARITRGNVSASLSVALAVQPARMRIDRALLDRLMETAIEVRSRYGHGEIDIASLMALRGVIVPEDDGVLATRGDQELDAPSRELDSALIGSLDDALGELCATRAAEGERLSAILRQLLDEIVGLTRSIAESPARNPDVVVARVRQAVMRLLSEGDNLDPARLHQEAALLAMRTDIEEELSRLQVHASATRALLAGDGPCGRKLDFIAQELNREANTICSKAQDGGITTLGLGLKAAIDRFKEQVQNVE